MAGQLARISLPALGCSRPFSNTVPKYLWKHHIHKARADVTLPLPGKSTQPGTRHVCHIYPLDLAWGTNLNVDSNSLASDLFAFSIIPYAGFLYHLTRSQKAPPLMLFGWYFLLVFVFATIPAGIYAKVKLGTSLANVDWLHGSAESMLTVTNLLIVLGLRHGVREAEQKQAASKGAAEEVDEAVEAET